MVKLYKTDLETNKFEKTDKYEKGVWINLINPTEKEISEVCEKTHIEPDFIKYPLDYEEQARIDQEEDLILFVIDVPIIEQDEEEKIYTTMPLGMIVVRDDYLITVSLRHHKLLEDFEKGKVKSFFTYKKSRFLFQMFYANSSYYLQLLKQINKRTEQVEDKLKESMKNKELIEMLNLEKSLVYFTTSLRANELVMEKTLRGKILKLYEEDEDILEDAIVENKQAIEMTKIYSDILNGTMDAYASLISNNLNTVMKFLTAITIVLAFPTMIASFFGMNVTLPMQQSPYGFILVILLSILVATITTIWLKKKDMF